VIKNEAASLNLNDIDEWNFDGSSTKQAEGKFSDCVLKPVRLYYNNQYTNIKTTYVFCEVMNPDGTPHETNQRHLLGDEDSNFWVGFEQEYFIRDGRDKSILGHNESKNGYIGLEPQGKYYCGVGSNVVGRELVEKHLDFCLTHGINITGTNAEVALGQWEYQVFAEGNKKACDDLWMARYFMEKISETYGYSIEYHPKPLGNLNWNGSGLHTNFSNKKMREVGGEEYFKSIFNAFDSRHKNHIEVYGSDNHMRLTGKHETQSIDKFSVGVSDRGASIRIPAQTANNGWVGYLEDRRPASNANPYDIIRVITETLKMSEELFAAHNNMTSNVSHKQISELYGKYKTLSPDELLNEYKED
jgi:glutamine synthetase